MPMAITQQKHMLEHTMDYVILAPSKESSYKELMRMGQESSIFLLIVPLGDVIVKPTLDMKVVRNVRDLEEL
jgi:hypothetical protein